MPRKTAPVLGKKAVWKDDTSYTRGESGKVEPRTLAIEVPGGHLRVVVTRLHQLEGWYLVCHAVGFSTHRRLADDLAVAQVEAVTLVRGRLLEMMGETDAMMRVEGATDV